MSGIYIKGMEMPTSCCNCPLAKLSPTGETLICNYTLSTVPWDDKPFDCPLIPAPEHGRLCDVDAICKGCRRVAEEFDGIYPDCTYCPVHLAPTIIPADKEGEE